MSEHTPGSWTVNGSETTTAVWVEANGKRVCTMRPCDQDLSNAHLIAAAPELLAALDALTNDCLEYIAINNLSGAENNQVLTKARAAITKTKGVKS